MPQATLAISLGFIGKPPVKDMEAQPYAAKITKVSRRYPDLITDEGPHIANVHRSFIVYSSDVGGKHRKHNLYVVAPDGETTIRLTQGDWKESYAFWTGEGKFIYFNSDRGGATNIYRMLMDGYAWHLRESGVRRYAL